MSVEEIALRKINDIQKKLLSISFDQDQYNWLFYSIVKNYIMGFIEFCERSGDLYNVQCEVLRRMLLDNSIRFRETLIAVLNKIIQYINESAIETRLLDYDEQTYFNTNIKVLTNYSEYKQALELGQAV